MAFTSIGANFFRQNALGSRSSNSFRQNSFNNNFGVNSAFRRNSGFQGYNPIGFNRQNPTSFFNNSENDYYSSILPTLNSLFSLFFQLLNQLGQSAGNPGPQPDLNPEFVDGSSGPFNPNVTGGFGRNAFANRQNLIDAGLFDPTKTTVRFTREDNKQFGDLFGYAEESIGYRDFNGDGTLNFQEYSNSLGTGNAQTGFQVMDINQDGQIDVVELSALGLFTDSNGDGQITPEERAQAEEMIQTSPEFASLAMGEIINTLELDQRYNQFLLGNNNGQFFFDGV